MSRRGAGAKKEKDDGPGLASSLLLAGGAAAVGFLAYNAWNSWTQSQTEQQMPTGRGPGTQGSRPHEDFERKDNWKRKETRAAARDSEVPDAVKCIVCMENPREIILMPCYHVCLCEDCGEKVMAERRQFCPVCREPIKETRAAYLP